MVGAMVTLTHKNTAALAATPTPTPKPNPNPNQVTLRHKNTSALAAFRMGSGRSLYVLSLSPPLDAVSAIEIQHCPQHYEPQP